MKLHLFSPALVQFHLIIATAIVIVLPSFYCLDDHYSTCHDRYSCGRIQNVWYPFWGDNLEKHCGHPSFMLRCKEGRHGKFPVMTVAGHVFQVRDIDQGRHTLKIARRDLVGNLCPDVDKFVNTTLDHSLFAYSPTAKNFTLFYGCQNFSTINWTKFRCNLNGTRTIGYFADESMAEFPELMKKCQQNIVVPLDQKAHNKLFSSRTTLRNALSNGFSVDYFVQGGTCKACEGSGGICGSNSTSTFVCLRKSKLSPVPGPNKRISVLKILIGIPSIISGILVFVMIISMFRNWRSCMFFKMGAFCMPKGDQSVEVVIRKNGHFAPKRYRCSELKKITNSLKHKLGQGGYGIVYKGTLPDGRLVAVKILNELRETEEEFINEVVSISQTSHVNIVSLLGFCFQGRKRALIYEYMSNGSLEKFIYDGNSTNASRNLRWEKLLEIAVGIAKGLDYLHQGCSCRIVHFDIKPHNILLDDNFCPKISDFGLAKPCFNKESTISMKGTRGTVGYIAPEVVSTRRVSHKSDVFSYGMMVLEMVGGRKNMDAEVEYASRIYFPQWVYKRLLMSEDLGLNGVMNREDEEIAKKMVLVGLWCIQTKPSDRPSITEALDMLQGCTNALTIPPKPFMCSVPGSPALTFNNASLCVNAERLTL